MSALTYTCFGCFQECTADPPPPGQQLICPCGAVLATGAAPAAAPPADFGVTDRDRQAMTAGKVTAAYEAQAQADALLVNILKGARKSG
jgi:hypothetical protein